MDYSKLLNGAKDYAKKQITPENLLKQASKYQGKQKNPNMPAQTGQTEAAPTATATSSTVTKYLPYIVAAIAIVIVIFVMKKK